MIMLICLNVYCNFLGKSFDCLSDTLLIYFFVIAENILKSTITESLEQLEPLGMVEEALITQPFIMNIV